MKDKRGLEAQLKVLSHHREKKKPTHLSLKYFKLPLRKELITLHE